MERLLAEIDALKEVQWLMIIFHKFFVAIVTILIAIIIIKVSKAFIHKVFSINTRVSQRKSKTLSTIAESVVKYLIYFFAFCQILTLLGVDITSIIAVAGVGSVAIGFGAQSLVKDILSGIFILMEDQFGVGDIISINGLSGTVENITIRTTRIRSVDGNLHIIPNGSVDIITNMSKGFNRAVVDVGIAYEEDIDRAMDIMADELIKIYKSNKIKGLIKIPEVLGVVDLGESAVTIRISADSQIGENWQIEREIRRLIKNRLDKENICIPYPQQVVHIINAEKGN